MKTQLFFFSDLPAVIHTSVIKLLTKPHPVIETLAERTWRLRTIWLLPYYSSMKISHPALFLVTRYSRWSNVLDRFRLNSIRHFRCFYKVVRHCCNLAIFKFTGSVDSLIRLVKRAQKSSNFLLSPLNVETFNGFKYRFRSLWLWWLSYS